MRNLLSVWVRVVMIFALCLGITLLIAAMTSLWERRLRSNTPTSAPIPPAANIAAPREESKLDTAGPTDGESNRAYSVHPQYIDWWFEH